jgi:diguanylate cyclase (GGDEF)-like protein
LVSGDELVGAISLYTTESIGFSDNEKRILEAVARQIAHTLKTAAEFDTASRRDALTGLPNLAQLEQFVGTEGMPRISFTLLLIDVAELKQLNERYGRTVADNTLRHVVRHATAGLRVADILFRCDNDEFVAFLNDTDSEGAIQMGERIRAQILGHPLTVDAEQTIRVDVRVTAVSAPADGSSLTTLLEVARKIQKSERTINTAVPL